MLDILEHLSWEDAVATLKQTKEMLGNHKIVVTMPNVTPYSPYTLIEAGTALTKGQRPEKGLLDKTHQILTDLAGHKRLFEEAGYEVEEMYSTSPFEDVTGDWEWKETRKTSGELLEERGSKLYKAYKILGRKVGPKVLATFKKGLSEQEAEALITSYQGVYLIKPKETQTAESS